MPLASRDDAHTQPQGQQQQHEDALKYLHGLIQNVAVRLADAEVGVKILTSKYCDIDQREKAQMESLTKLINEAIKSTIIENTLQIRKSLEDKCKEVLARSQTEWESFIREKSAVIPSTKAAIHQVSETCEKSAHDITDLKRHVAAVEASVEGTMKKIDALSVDPQRSLVAGLQGRIEMLETLMYTNKAQHGESIESLKQQLDEKCSSLDLITRTDGWAADLRSCRADWSMALTRAQESVKAELKGVLEKSKAEKEDTIAVLNKNTEDLRHAIALADDGVGKLNHRVSFVSDSLQSRLDSLALDTRQRIAQHEGLISQCDRSLRDVGTSIRSEIASCRSSCEASARSLDQMSARIDGVERVCAELEVKLTVVRNSAPVEPPIDTIAARLAHLECDVRQLSESHTAAEARTQHLQVEMTTATEERNDMRDRSEQLMRQMCSDVSALSTALAAHEERSGGAIHSVRSELATVDRSVSAVKESLGAMLTNASDCSSLKYMIEGVDQKYNELHSFVRDVTVQLQEIGAKYDLLHPIIQSVKFASEETSARMEETQTNCNSLSGDLARKMENVQSIAAKALKDQQSKCDELQGLLTTYFENFDTSVSQIHHKIDVNLSKPYVTEHAMKVLQSNIETNQLKMCHDIHNVQTALSEVERHCGDLQAKAKSTAMALQQIQYKVDHIESSSLEHQMAYTSTFTGKVEDSSQLMREVAYVRSDCKKLEGKLKDWSAETERSLSEVEHSIDTLKKKVNGHISEYRTEVEGVRKQVKDCKKSVQELSEKQMTVEQMNIKAVEAMTEHLDHIEQEIVLGDKERTSLEKQLQLVAHHCESQIKSIAERKADAELQAKHLFQADDTSQRIHIEQGKVSKGPSPAPCKPGVGFDCRDTEHGVAVTYVKLGGSADLCGVRCGDIITAVGGIHVHTREQYKAIITGRSPGDIVQHQLKRGGDEMIQINIVLGYSKKTAR